MLLLQAELKPGEVGYRYHASMPPTAKLDYIVTPRQHMEGDDGGRAGTALGAPPGRPQGTPPRLAGRLRDLERKNKNKAARAGKIDVEGRTLGA